MASFCYRNQCVYLKQWDNERKRRRRKVTVFDLNKLFSNALYMYKISRNILNGFQFLSEHHLLTEMLFIVFKRCNSKNI